MTMIPTAYSFSPTAPLASSISRFATALVLGAGLLSTSANAQCPGDDPFEPNDDCATAVPIAPGSQGLLSVTQTSEDWYQVTVPPGATLSVNLNFVHALGDLDVALFTNCFVVVGFSNTAADFENVTHTNQTGAPVQYSIRVSLVAGNCNDYDLNVNLSTPPVCVDDPFEPNDSCTTATPIPAAPQSGLNIDSGTEDWYVIPVGSNQRLLVDVGFQHSNGDIDAELYGPNDCANVLESSLTATDGESLSFANLSGAQVPIKLRVFRGDTQPCAQYALNIDVQQVGGGPLLVPGPLGKLSPPAPIPGDRFGTAIALEDELMVVGGVGAWVFLNNISGQPELQSQLSAPFTTPEFGQAVDVSDGRVIVADAGNDDAGINATVRVFEFSGTSWDLAAVVPPAGMPPFTGFGACCAISGDTIVVGAPWSGSNHGLAYVYRWNGSQWNEVRVLSAANPEPGYRFGASVDIDGGTIVVGAPGSRAGVYVYQVSGPGPVVSVALENTFDEDGNVSPQAMAAGPNFSGFGESVAIDAGTILVGRPDDDQSSMDAGGISVFRNDGSGWNFRSTSTASDSTPGRFFGRKVALSGDLALVGSRYDGPIGATYVFQRNLGGQFGEVAKLIPTEGNPGDGFGSAVAVHGQRIVVGSPQDSDVDSWTGAVYPLIAPTTFPLEYGGFCFGDGGDGQGCTDCPCGNNAPAGTIGGCLNSAGTSARLDAVGKASVSGDTLRFEVLGATPSTFAILFSGDAQTPVSPAIPCAAGSGVQSPAFDGLRCVAGAILRHGTRTSDANGDVGALTAGWGGPFGPPGGLVAHGAFTAGQTRFFQTVYRVDAINGCGTGLNTTNGMPVLVLP